MKIFYKKKNVKRTNGKVFIVIKKSIVEIIDKYDINVINDWEQENSCTK